MCSAGCTALATRLAPLAASLKHTSLRAALRGLPNSCLQAYLIHSFFLSSCVVPTAPPLVPPAPPRCLPLARCAAFQIHVNLMPALCVHRQLEDLDREGWDEESLRFATVPLLGQTVPLHRAALIVRAFGSSEPAKPASQSKAGSRQRKR